jgi:cyclic pyranopterin phosphate synthase
MNDAFTHLNDAGEVRMVDITNKEVTKRSATAHGIVKVNQSVITLINSKNLPKGDLFSTVRLAGIMAAKKTSELIPLCHPLAISGVEVVVEIKNEAISITAIVKSTDRTGVEMEALTAVSIAALTAIDMVKAVDKSATIESVRLIEKTGGKSGTWTSEK